jgi:hypothetical protein
MKRETNFLSDSGSKKRKPPSSDLDILELSYTSDSDRESESDGDMSDECDSESVETCESRAKQSLSTSFFEILKQLTIEELNEPTRQWHCPACRNAPGAVVWYKGLKDLMHHVQTESSRVSHHRKLAALLEDPHGTSLLAADKPFDNGKGLQKSSLCRPVAKVNFFSLTEHAIFFVILLPYLLE